MTEALLVTASGCGLRLSSSTDGKAGARMKTEIIRSYVRLPFVSQDGKELVLVGTNFSTKLASAAELCAEKHRFAR
jgi:hypothetical protein